MGIRRPLPHRKRVQEKSFAGTRPPGMNRVAVIGAGLCGAAAAARLVASDFQVTVFDKGRAVGGRMSSKRSESGYLDMGAQYFTARSTEFQSQVQAWLKAGCAQVWHCTTAVLNTIQAFLP